jgi:hypothetical protein
MSDERNGPDRMNTKTQRAQREAVGSSLITHHSSLITCPLWAVPGAGWVAHRIVRRAGVVRGGRVIGRTACGLEYPGPELRDGFAERCGRCARVERSNMKRNG